MNSENANIELKPVNNKPAGPSVQARKRTPHREGKPLYRKLQVVRSSSFDGFLLTKRTRSREQRLQMSRSQRTPEPFRQAKTKMLQGSSGTQ
jgi:hypothetical protein